MKKFWLPILLTATILVPAAQAQAADIPGFFQVERRYMDARKFFRRILAALLIGLCVLASSVVNAEEDSAQKVQTLTAEIQINPHYTAAKNNRDTCCKALAGLESQKK